MLASYFLSRTVVPTMAKYLLKGHEHDRVQQARASRNPFVRFQIAFEHSFENLRDWYHGVLRLCLRESRRVSALDRRRSGSSRWRCSTRGWDRTSSLRWMAASSSCMCARTPEPASKIRRGCAIRSRTWSAARFPRSELGTVIDNIGLPYSGLNLSYSNSAPVGTGDADILVSLAEKHRPTAEYTRALRDKLTAAVSRHRVLLPANRHGEPDSELRPARADRCAGDGPAGGREPRPGRALDAADRPHPGTTDLRIQQPFNQPNGRSTSTAPAPRRSATASAMSRRTCLPA